MHKQKKAMVNEFDCTLKPKAYTKIVQASMKSIINVIKLLAFDLERIIFISFRYAFHQALACLYCDLIGRLPMLPMVPAIQPIYQNVIENCLEVDNFDIG